MSPTSSRSVPATPSNSPASSPSPSGQPPGTLEVARGLSQAHLEGIAALEAACGAVDGGRLKLEYPTLRARPSHEANDFLWRSAEGDVVAFCGIYQNRADEVEICGMVHHARRREGIFTRLLDEALAGLARRGVERVLLIVDRSCEAGVSFALNRGGTLDSSEYRMLQQVPPPLQGAPDGLSLRPATTSPADRELVRECLRRAFGLPEEAVEAADAGGREGRTLVIEHDGTPLGVIRPERDSDAGSAGIYGFAVLPEWQGRGYGRATLSMLTRQLHEEGFAVVHLEVLVDNPAALHLYETCGFTTTGVEDYYLLPLP